MQPVLRTVLALPILIATGIMSQSAMAQLASKPANEWINILDASNRLAGLKIEETIAKLKLQPGATVVDVGAGSGLFTLPLARAVAPNGVVYAVDIERGLLDHIATLAKDSQVTNIQTVLGKFTDPNLPKANIDLAFINDVLHHIEDRQAYLKSLAKYIKPGGRIAVIDFYPELGVHKDDPTLQITKEQTDGWMAEIGFRPTEQYDLFKDKWFVVYSK